MLWYTIGIFLGCFIFTLLTIPKIINVVKYKNLMDDPGSRSSHEQKTPTLGGVSFYLSFVGTLFFIRNFAVYEEAIYLMPALTIIFISGLKDDLVSISPKAKLLAQFCAIAFVLYNPSFAITSLHGFMGIGTIPQLAGAVLSAFFMIVVINAFNLIDGIDGLAAMVGLVISGAYAFIFYTINQGFFVLLCLALQGCLLAFLYYNLSVKRKIFMGDTGSLLVGFIISLLTIKLLAVPMEDSFALPFLRENTPIIIISILIVPLLDTARVFIVRILNKRSPFSADRNHLHHLFTDGLLLSHKRASFFISVLNLLFIGLIMILSNYLGYKLLLPAFSLAVFLILLYCIPLKKNKERFEEKPEALKRLMEKKK
ncbi:undecaprenyl/decaprenyl-phosphate alpha-N-acetylglucosaminyl 1-phosphate transferase [Zhouia spongiae]|uniref:Undecaprenyl/decaprenyl-phosphate alpha-N-acetylglucosaminyl 1-phosphate transferase n=1 Tax=Zhouia spongiae TaxID=2202721 RepID=A0ABY3YJL7_9FLAO|nr:MraY family glycosyltransferase [Zhouia spongiae]UNY97910.1 undecaprenyl/decaprenyl-phosphate alpha-N-acetylglucosaminyl 1-phosphate transferase [Zhouia spongiae]